MRVVPAGQATGAAGMPRVAMVRHPSAPSGEDAPCRSGRAYFRVLR